MFLDSSTPAFLWSHIAVSHPSALEADNLAIGFLDRKSSAGDPRQTSLQYSKLTE
jgi:hypothetical protein